MLRRFLICFAFANLCFLDTWVEYAEGGVVYFARRDPVEAVMLPVVCLEIVLTLCLMAAWQLCRRWRLERAAPIHFLFVASCLAPMGILCIAGLRALPFDLTPIIRNHWLWRAAMASTLILLLLVGARAYKASRLMKGLLLYSWPLLILLLIQSARTTFVGTRTALTPMAHLPRHSSHGRTGRASFGSFFDELSQTIAFGNRPRSLALPNFDRLKRGSFYASSALPPSDSTEISMPSLILGERLLDVSPDGPNDLRVSKASRAEPVAWSSLPNVFDAARDLGFSTALVDCFNDIVTN